MGVESADPSESQLSDQAVYPFVYNSLPSKRSGTLDIRWQIIDKQTFLAIALREALGVGEKVPVRLPAPAMYDTTMASKFFNASAN